MSARAYVVAGLGFGDEGKGTTVDWLVRRHGARTVVRFNGGAQAGHNVVLPGGEHHCFSQFGAGALAGAQTFLSRHVAVAPELMLREAEVLGRLVKDPLAGVYVDEDCLITTRFHAAANRLREIARGPAAHGSCGMGVGETVGFAERHPGLALRVHDLFAPRRLQLLLRAQQAVLAAELEALFSSATSRQRLHEVTDLLSADIAEAAEPLTRWLAQVSVVGSAKLGEFLDDGVVVFEGAQGMLLDQDHPFFPHVTRSSTGPGNALELLRSADFDRKDAQVWGVSRTYTTRHGAGPMPTHDPAWGEGEPHNARNPWQSGMRSGPLDLVLLGDHKHDAYDRLVLTHCDRFDHKVPVCTAYDIGSQRLVRLPRDGAQQVVYLADRARPVLGNLHVHQIAECLELPLALTSRGPTHLDKTEMP